MFYSLFISVLVNPTSVLLHVEQTLYTCTQWGGGLHSVMVKAMNCEIVVSEFVLQSHYYVHFRENTLGKGMKPLILPAKG